MTPTPLFAAWRMLMLCAALLATGAVHELSLGDASLQSRVGEPLRVSIPLGHLGTVDRNSIIVGHAPDADYDRFDMEHRSGSARTLHFQLEVDRNDRASIEVRTAQPVSEPYVDMVVQVRWPSGRLVRAYTLLLDLPPQR